MPDYVFSELNISLGKPTCMWEDNTEMYLREIGRENMEWFDAECEEDKWQTLANTVMIKSRRMRWAGHVARMGEERGAYSVLLGKPQGR